MDTRKIKLSIQITLYCTDLELFYDYGRIKKSLESHQAVATKADVDTEFFF